jgi:hypothetical protein
MKKVEQKPLSPHLDEREKQMWEDYEWCLHDLEVRRKYAGKVVVAYHRKVWGAGRNHLLAWLAAKRKRGCPARECVAIVPVPAVGLT